MEKIKTIRLKQIKQSELDGAVYKITGRGHRIVGDQVIESSTSSVTFAPVPIVELPRGTLHGEVTKQAAIDKVSEMVIASELSADETTAILSLYPAYEEDKPYSKDDLFVYDNTLYKVNQSHTSQAHWVPGVGTDALYSPAAPAGVIPVWVQPQGAHDAYQIGDQVEFQGNVWESKINANVWVPDGDVPYNRHWYPID